MSLRVYGLVLHDGQDSTQLPTGVRLIAFRELSAVAEEGDFRAKEAETPDVERHLAVVEAIFTRQAILPAPVGAVFRSDDILLKWMELHYVALSDALAWVEERIAARVHITRAAGRESDKEAGSDLAALAADITRSLRRHAVATVPLRHEQVTGIVSSAAYLVERNLWQEFSDAVGDERERHQHVTMELTGPWPPYDFVRFQFGS